MYAKIKGQGVFHHDQLDDQAVKLRNNGTALDRKIGCENGPKKQILVWCWMWCCFSSSKLRQLKLFTLRLSKIAAWKMEDICE